MQNEVKGYVLTRSGSLYDITSTGGGSNLKKKAHSRETILTTDASIDITKKCASKHPFYTPAPSPTQQNGVRMRKSPVKPGQNEHE